ncbi:hypothetical protein BO82DRAFT_434546 [Aspergillus uvarum CBS 121591]|uniref:Uncharacterized protein n=1 Tax=Aspergillus uvarum CBS 121591 TaxID=1448315 RepID=A0A319C5A3_9EURO|nr:hypothetical protein BO82DRAFT_434546 [Aspergillus uvarum CBS 121591]PYH79069.1 hypothetical protein BO82DRAFT_434546 [Aspergillus uvarum CBS 121591]
MSPAANWARAAPRLPPWPPLPPPLPPPAGDRSFLKSTRSSTSLEFPPVIVTQIATTSRNQQNHHQQSNMKTTEHIRSDTTYYGIFGGVIEGYE